MEAAVWYDCPKGAKPYTEHAVHAKVFPHVKALEHDQRDVAMLNSLNSKLYSNRESMTFEQDRHLGSNLRPLSTNLENVIQSVVSTLVSKIGSNRPKAAIISRGGEFSVFLKSRQLERFMWGEFVHHGVHKKLERCFKDACIYGTGFLKIDDDGDIYCERVHPSEMVIDQRECISNDLPIQMHQRKLVSKLWLKKTYAQKGMHNWKDIRRHIDELDTKDGHYTNYQTKGVEQVLIVESWKLATCKGADDGRHTICIENYTLVDEAYTRDRFPFVIQKWEEPESGFYGRALVGDLIGYQIRLNDLNEAIKFGQDIMCVPRLLIEQGSGVQAQQLDNVMGKGLKYRGTKPEAVTWGAFNTEIYNERDRIEAAAFKFAGLSQLSAQGELPKQARLDSSEALREYNAIEDGRFNDKTQNYEEAAKQTASHLIELNAAKYKGQKKATVRTFRLGNLVKQIDWADVDMDRDKYVLEIGASSVLNMTPAARKDILNSWLAGGIITPDKYKAWSGHEDLERLADIMSAGKDYVEYQIDYMLRQGAILPDINMNVAEGFNTVLNTYQQLRTLDTPSEITARFVNWLLAAKQILEPKEEPMPAPQDPMMGATPQPGPEAMMPPGNPMEAAGMQAPMPGMEVPMQQPPMMGM